MKKLFQFGVWIILPAMIFANMFIFVSGIVLGNQISNFERETKKIHQANVQLDARASHLDSLEYAASVAASLDFTKRSTPIVLDNLRYALNR